MVIKKGFSHSGKFLLAASLTAVFCGAIIVSGCRTVPKVERVGADTQIDLSGNWNDTDSRLVAEEMVKDALYGRPWISEFKTAKNTKPRVIVGKVLNKSHEHINTETFVKDLERELINSGEVKFVASSEQRQEIRAERDDQAAEREDVDGEPGRLHEEEVRQQGDGRGQPRAKRLCQGTQPGRDGPLGRPWTVPAR